MCIDRPIDGVIYKLWWRFKDDEEKCFNFCRMSMAAWHKETGSNISFQAGDDSKKSPTRSKYLLSIFECY